MSSQQRIFLISEDISLIGELASAARRLNGDDYSSIAAVVVGDQTDVHQVGSYGVDSIYWVDQIPDGYLFEDVFLTLLELVQQHNPSSIWIGATTSGRLICGRLAARLDVSAITDVRSFEQHENKVVMRHMIFAGGAERLERPLRLPALITVAKGQFAAEVVQHANPPKVITLPFLIPEKRAVLLERKDLPAVSVNLADAKRVICLGRGIARQEHLALAENLADELGAEIACTRPLSEGLGWLPRERYIGISGAYIKSDLYIGLGVSGQVQHTVGITDAKVIVAVNRDPDAPIFKQADYGIAADLYEVLPALIQAIRSTKGA
ncbi:MAG: electron transfer flavoprotein subunit alpha/FixB family protein [Bellilinea sp.]